MLVISKKGIYELEVMKSRFIALIYPFNNKDELNDKLKEVKDNYPKAKHYLYAYKLDNLTKSNDDKEPGNIMKAVLTLIDKKELNHLLIIVVRYFGGIKLGASRLLRTYVNVCSKALNHVEVKELILVHQYKGKVDYKTFNEIKSRGYFIANAKYFDTIEIEIISKIDISDELKRFKITRLVHQEIKTVL